MNTIRLTASAARALHLAAQGLLHPPRRRARKEDVLATIRRMGALQIDTISVVARSPYLVLWSRLGDYDPKWLDQLLEEGKIFEYWAHEACFLPIEDYPLFRHRMLNPDGMGWKFRRSAAAEALGRKLLAHIREHGPVRARDFSRPSHLKTGWWQWTGEKRVLENLLTAGELMIARRQNFQRVYDLRERVLPGWDDRQLPPGAETDRILAAQAIRALGITQERWVHDYYRMKRARTASQLPRLLADGTIMQVEVQGWNASAYVHRDHAELLEQAMRGKLGSTVTTLLSPFDPIVWDRTRAQVMFDFDYRLECYTPAPKRVYGYYVLPILRNGRLVGRLDAKAHRQTGEFEVRNLVFERGLARPEGLIRDVARAIYELAVWHGTPNVRGPERAGSVRVDRLAHAVREAVG